MKDLVKVADGKGFKLSDIRTDGDSGLDKASGEARLAELGQELSELADLQFYAGQTPLLIVLQGMDTSGKDGMIRCLLSHLNAQSLNVCPFKVPTSKELSRDFLWRCHAVAPGRGEIAIFNRSHYEDVLVVRVHNLVPETKWKARYEHIRHFEKLLSDNDTVVLKFFLHISKEEQEQRLLEREKETEKAWKLSVGDWKERELWDDYQQAYEDAIRETATSHAPWHVVPADRKWHRNLVVVETLVHALKQHEAAWTSRLEAIGEKALDELTAYRAEFKS